MFISIENTNSTKKEIFLYFVLPTLMIYQNKRNIILFSEFSLSPLYINYDFILIFLSKFLAQAYSKKEESSKDTI